MDFFVIFHSIIAHSDFISDTEIYKIGNEKLLWCNARRNNSWNFFKVSISKKISKKFHKQLPSIPPQLLQFPVNWIRRSENNFILHTNPHPTTSVLVFFVSISRWKNETEQNEEILLQSEIDCNCIIYSVIGISANNGIE